MNRFGYVSSEGSSEYVPWQSSQCSENRLAFGGQVQIQRPVFRIRRRLQSTQVRVDIRSRLGPRFGVFAVFGAQRGRQQHRRSEVPERTRVGEEEVLLLDVPPRRDARGNRVLQRPCVFGVELDLGRPLQHLGVAMTHHGQDHQLGRVGPNRLHLRPRAARGLDPPPRSGWSSTARARPEYSPKSQEPRCVPRFAALGSGCRARCERCRTGRCETMTRTPTDRGLRCSP